MVAWGQALFHAQQSMSMACYVKVELDYFHKEFPALILVYASIYEEEGKRGFSTN